jgi:hypothetical protein
MEILQGIERKRNCMKNKRYSSRHKDGKTRKTTWKCQDTII